MYIRVILYLNVFVYLISFENLRTNNGFESHKLKILRTKFMTQDLLEVVNPVLTPHRFSNR